MAMRYRGPLVAHWALTQVTWTSDGFRDVYRVDTDHGWIHEHRFHVTGPPGDSQGRRTDIERILTVQHKGFQQLAAAYDRHYDNCRDNWEGRLQRWRTSRQ